MYNKHIWHNTQHTHTHSFALLLLLLLLLLHQYYTLPSFLHHLWLSLFSVISLFGFSSGLWCLWLSLSLSLSLFCAIAAAECAFCFLWVKLPPLPLSFSFFFAFLSFYRSITSTSPQTQKRYTHKHGPIHFTTSNKSNKCGLFFFSWLQLPSWVRDTETQRQTQRECEWISSYSEDFQRDSVGWVLQPQQIKQN